MAVQKTDIGNELNKISYGLVYDQTRSVWINEKRQTAIAIGQNKISLIEKQEYNLSYPIALRQQGFTMTSKEDPDDILQTGKKIFENNQFILNVEAMVSQEEGHSIISIIRK